MTFKSIFLFNERVRISGDRWRCPNAERKNIFEVSQTYDCECDESDLELLLPKLDAGGCSDSRGRIWMPISGWRVYVYVLYCMVLYSRIVNIEHVYYPHHGPEQRLGRP